MPTSVLDDVRLLGRRVSERLAELEPLVREYEELQRVAQRLELDTQPPARTRAPARSGSRRSARAAKRPAAAKPRATGRSGAPGRRRPGGTQATGRERRELLLTLIGERPGITVRELADEIGVEAPPIYRVIRKLQSEGLVTKEGTALRLA